MTVLNLKKMAFSITLTMVLMTLVISCMIQVKILVISCMMQVKILMNFSLEKVKVITAIIPALTITNVVDLKNVKIKMNVSKLNVNPTKNIIKT